MATTYTADLVTYSERANVSFPDGNVIVRESTYEVAAALVINDVIQMIPVFADERVVGLTLMVEDDLDSNGAPAVVIDVGDGDDPNRYIAGSTVGQAGGVAQYASGIAATAAAAAALDKQYSAEDTIDVLIATAPATSAVTGTIKMRALIVKY